MANYDYDYITRRDWYKSVGTSTIKTNKLTADPQPDDNSADPQPDGNSAFGWMQLLHAEPLCQNHPSSFKTWNGKIYGYKGNYHYYIHDVKYWMSDEQAAKIKSWHKALYAWMLRNNVKLDDPYFGWMTLTYGP